jgi:hypothetical protein
MRPVIPPVRSDWCTVGMQHCPTCIKMKDILDECHSAEYSDNSDCNAPNDMYCMEDRRPIDLDMEG